MSIRPAPFLENEFYHIYNRGNSRQDIFLDEEDYARFVGLLYACNSIKKFHSNNLGITSKDSFFKVERVDELVAIGAYVLMPNHFHILMTPLVPEGISVFMQKLSTAYVMYFNRKYSRVGSLFEGKFRSTYVSEDRYLKYLFSYIHLNPMKLLDSDWKQKFSDKKLFEYIKSYQYSSYLDFTGMHRLETKILSRLYFPIYFKSKKDYADEILSWFRSNA